MFNFRCVLTLYLLMFICPSVCLDDIIDVIIQHGYKTFTSKLSIHANTTFLSASWKLAAKTKNNCRKKTTDNSKKVKYMWSIQSICLFRLYLKYHS